MGSAVPTKFFLLCSIALSSQLGFHVESASGSQCGSHVCKAYEVCDATYNVCKCPDACPFHYQPVCGSDGVTYGNMCLLSSASCGSNGAIRFSKQGPCD